jgi:hypothetical protein
VECLLTPGGFGDVDALKYYAYELPNGAIIYADKAYNDYDLYSAHCHKGLCSHVRQSLPPGYANLHRRLSWTSLAIE